jgi:RNA polymerase sigma factor (sigma-70 family)
MATPTLGKYLHRLKQAMSAESLSACSDRELVERFRSTRDDDAFRAIIDRHGPMVFQVCRRFLTSSADVEDAFQATFLILVRKGHTIRRQASLGSWLHGVARRVALKIRTQSDRRQRREKRAASPEPVGDDTSWRELRSILDDELQRLPDACRAPLVLCYLEGRTQDEAAVQLDVSKSTLRRHLERGREMLGRRLALRGVSVGSALAACLVSDSVSGAALPRALLMRTTESASHTAANLAAPASVLTPQVAAISDGVIKTMQYAKYKTIVAVLACGVALGFGIHQFSPTNVSAQDKTPAATARTPTAPDIEPIDPNLVFDKNVQKTLKLSENQVRKLTDAREKGTHATADQGAKVKEIDQQMKKLQEQLERLSNDRSKALQSIQKAEHEQVKKAIPEVLSRDAVQQLRQLTLQAMRLTDVLLNEKVRVRLNLNDEQVKKIQEIGEKPNALITYTNLSRGFLTHDVAVSRFLLADDVSTAYLIDSLSVESKADLLKVLTPAQRLTLEKLSGMKFEPKK